MKLKIIFNLQFNKLINANFFNNMLKLLKIIIKKISFNLPLIQLLDKVKYI